MIKNIVFDIGNVILEGKPSDCLEYYDIENQKKEIIKKIVFENKKWKELDYGRLNFEEYFKIVSPELPENLKKCAKEILLSSMKKRKINDEIMKLIKTLKTNGYKIFILSDNNIDTYDHLKTTELDKYIDEWYISAHYNATKSDSKLFEIFLNESNIKANESYFIDDKRINIEKAKNLGMEGFVLDWTNNDFENLIEDMRKKQIL